MANFKYNEKNIYYEVHNESNEKIPLLLLNGVMMSTASWQMFLPELAKKSKIILVDFIDQGQSDKHTEKYSIDLQVEVIKSLLDELKLEKVNIVSISYGGSVAMKFATKYQSFVNKLILFNTTAKTGEWLGAIGDSWILSSNDPLNFYNTTIPIIYSQNFYNTNKEWIEERKDFLLKYAFSNKDFLERVTRLIKSLKSHDAISELSKITAKTLVIGSEDDYLTPVSCQRQIHLGIKNSDLVIIPNCGHASMYEKPELFTSLIGGYL